MWHERVTVTHRRQQYNHSTKRSLTKPSSKNSIIFEQRLSISYHSLSKIWVIYLLLRYLWRCLKFRNSRLKMLLKIDVTHISFFAKKLDHRVCPARFLLWKPKCWRVVVCRRQWMADTLMDLRIYSRENLFTKNVKQNENMTSGNTTFNSFMTEVPII